MTAKPSRFDAPPPGGKPAPSPAFAHDLESASAQAIVPISQEIPIYSTRRRWMACDVSVSLPQFLLAIGAHPDFIQLNIYAVVQGIRSIVASGCVSNPTSSGVVRLAAAARAQAERWDVTLSHGAEPVSVGRAPSPLIVGVIGTDFATDVPPTLGSIAATHAGLGAIIPPAVTTADFIILAPPGPGLQLTGLAASGDPADTKYLQVFDSAIAPVGGDVPVLSFAVGETDNELSIESQFLQQWRFRRGISVAASSTAATYTATTGLTFQAWFR